MHSKSNSVNFTLPSSSSKNQTMKTIKFPKKESLNQSAQKAKTSTSNLHQKNKFSAKIAKMEEKQNGDEFNSFKNAKIYNNMKMLTQEIDKFKHTEGHEMSGNN